jgi:hypothetical protein
MISCAMHSVNRKVPHYHPNLYIDIKHIGDKIIADGVWDIKGKCFYNYVSQQYNDSESIPIWYTTGATCC